MRSAPSHLGGQLILALALVDDMSQQPIRRPFRIRDLDDHFGPDPMDPTKHGYCWLRRLRLPLVGPL